uniref:OTU domain-containing protein n=1 Tax=viral metagenome TaxID=1070528 RepID=A0A6C0D5W2_9ZZZZ
MTIQWISKNVKGDGSCFYRALFRSASRHYNGPLVKNIYKCFGIRADDMEEEEFVKKIRNSLGNKIKNNIYDIMTESQRENILLNTHIESNNARMYQIESTMGLYDTLVNWARVDPEIYDTIIDEQPREFKNKFKTTEKFLKTSKEDFYEFLGDIVSNMSVYASEYDIYLVKWILEKCGTPIFLNMYSEETSPLIRKKNSMKALNIQRINENHYISWYETDNLNNVTNAMSKMKIKGGKRFKNKTRKYNKKTCQI